MKKIQFSWQDKKGKHTGTISFDELFGHIKKNKELVTTQFGLPSFQSPIFDSNIDLSLPQPITGLGDDGERDAIGIGLATNIGKSFPLKPSLRLEGFATSNLQGHVFENISVLHNFLVLNSNLALDLKSPWFMNFRMLLNECVSAIDMQLHMIYLQAEFNPNLGLKFDKAKMGDRFGRRLTDKFSWIGITTGNHLDNAEFEIKDFIRLKNLRNHLNHFDPPCFCCNVEEIVEWLNLVPSVGKLLYKIRDKFNAQLNNEILKIMMLNRAEFIPRPSYLERPKKKYSDSGYQSSTWKISK